MSRFHVLAAALVAAVLSVAAMAAINQSGAKDETPPAPASPAGSDPYAGIPQDGTALGRPDAPLTMVEFADLQCPFCRDYSVEALPRIVESYVRTGQLRLELRVLRFLGPDSSTAALAAAAAARHDRLWQFADLFYRNQGAENSGYVTHEFVHEIASDAGLKKAPFSRAMEAHHAEAMASSAEQEAHRLAVHGTPSFFLGKTGGTLFPVQVSELEFDEFARAIDAAR